MKKLILFACGVACAGSVLAQGTIVFNNRVVGSVVAPIYAVDPANPTTPTTGNTATGFPAGTTTYGGPLLSGSGFTVQLWAAPGANQTEASLQPATGYSMSSFRTGAAAGLWTSSVNPAIIPGAAEATVASLEVRVWDNVGGTITSWAQVLADNSIARGESPIFNSQPLGGVSPPPNLVGLVSFDLFTPTIVPEPSTFALAGLGAAALLVFRRRK